jgi:hypothetical protein
MTARQRILAMCVLLATVSHAYAMSLFDFCDFEGGPPKPHTIAGYTASYDQAKVPDLIGKLEAETDDTRRACWATVLGLTGDDRAVDALIASIARPFSPQEGPGWFERRTWEIRALGYLVNRTGNARALAYLIDGLKLGVWRTRNVQGLPPYVRSQEDYDRTLSDDALMALALSGDPRAGDALKSMQASPTPEQALAGKDLDDMLATWLEVHQLVAERGLQGMFDYYEARRTAEQARFAEEAQRKRAELYPNAPTN